MQRSGLTDWSRDFGKFFLMPNRCYYDRVRVVTRWPPESPMGSRTIREWETFDSYAELLQQQLESGMPPVGIAAVQGHSQRPTWDIRLNSR